MAAVRSNVKTIHDDNSGQLSATSLLVLKTFLRRSSAHFVTSCCISLSAPVNSCSLSPVASCSLLLVLCSCRFLLFVPVTSCYFSSYSRPHLVLLLLNLTGCFRLTKHTSQKLVAAFLPRTVSNNYAYRFMLSRHLKCQWNQRLLQRWQRTVITSAIRAVWQIQR
jgi:hypothetical protein